MRGNAARGDFLLGNHRHAGRGDRERVEDDPFGGAVADGDGGLVALGLDLKALGDQLENFRACRAGGGGQGVEEDAFVDHHSRSC